MDSTPSLSHLTKQLRYPYRVQLRPPEQLVVQLELDDRSVPALVTDLSCRGVGLTLDRTAEELQHGQVAQLRFPGSRSAAPVNTFGLVRHERRAAPAVSYGLEFLDWLGLLPQLSSYWRARFNERSHHRVRFEATDWSPELVVAIPRLGEVRARVADLSPGGIAVLAPTRRLLDVGGSVELSLPLPGLWESVHLSGNVHQLAPSIHPGLLRIRFDADRTPDFTSQQALIEDFLEVLRERS